MSGFKKNSSPIEKNIQDDQNADIFIRENSGTNCYDLSNFNSVQKNARKIQTSNIDFRISNLKR